tara:strand:- start:11846 stop:13519 length:1674 start_codon:yes stop_codon:yes gene_type:complete
VNNFLKIASLLTLGLAPARLLADEPPNGPPTPEILAQQDWEEVSDSSLNTVAGMFRAMWLVEEWRMRRSDVVVLKSIENMQSIPGGQQIPVYLEYKKFETPYGPRLYSRPIPPEEVQRREMEASDIPPVMMAQALEAYAGGAMMLGEALREEVAGSPMKGFLDQKLGFEYNMRSPFAGDRDAFDAEDCMYILEYQAAVESIVAGAAPGAIKPWTSINPATFMMGPACMALFASEVMRAQDVVDEETAQQMIEAMESAINEFQLAGTENLGDRPTARIRLDNVNMVQPIAGLPLEQLPGRDAAAGLASELNGDGDRTPAIYQYGDDAPFLRAKTRGGADGMFAINTIELWIDTEYFVQRKMRMEGVMTDQGESRDVFLEHEQQDYRNVPDSYVYLPYRKVMRAGGILSEAQRAELAEAQAQLEEFEQQMAAMPAGQRQMMERMMGGQIEQMRNLVNNGAIEIVMETVGVEINPSFRNPMLVEFARTELDSAGDSADNLVQRIQIDLTTLGYEPGNVEGDLDTMTQVAISQFQAEHSMAVTGQPSEELARTLRTAIFQQ